MRIKTPELHVQWLRQELAKNNLPPYVGDEVLFNDGLGREEPVATITGLWVPGEQREPYGPQYLHVAHYQIETLGEKKVLVALPGQLRSIGHTVDNLIRLNALR